MPGLFSSLVHLVRGDSFFHSYLGIFVFWFGLLSVFPPPSSWSSSVFHRHSLVGLFYLVILFALVSIVFARFLWVINFSFVGPLSDPHLLELSVLMEAGGTVGVMDCIERVLVIIPIFS